MKTSLKSLAVLATFAAVVTSVHADAIVLSSGSFSNLSYGGGAFLATPTSGSSINNASYASSARGGSSTGFLTFCLEYNEHFTSTYTYNYVLSNGATNGGAGGTGTYDGISNATAWLYSQFAQGALTTVSGFSYNQSGFDSMQRAVWYLEDEKNDSTNQLVGVSNYLVTAAKAQFGDNYSVWHADSNGAYGVQVMNLTRNGVKAQDQLYYHNVPEQGLTVALLGFAFLGLAGFRRKFSSK